MNAPMGHHTKSSFSLLLHLIHGQSMKFKTAFYFVFYLTLQSCEKDLTDGFAINTEEGPVNIYLESTPDANYLVCSDASENIHKWPLRYPVFKLLKGDVDADGFDDVLVGVVKSTRFDTTLRKRLFIFGVADKTIIPKWLGSSVSHPLEDFTVRFNGKQTLIRTIEVETDGSYLMAEYEWYGFGPSFREYLKRNISLSEAKVFLHK